MFQLASFRCAISLLVATSAQIVCAQVQMPSGVARAIRNLDSKSATIVLLREGLTNGFNSVVISSELADFDLKIVPPKIFEANPENRAWAQSMLGAEDAWLVVNINGKLVAKGGSLPTPADLHQKLVEGGVMTAESYLKRFLKENHGNHEARAELLNLIHKKAVNLTIRKLGIVPEKKEKEIEADYTATVWSGDPLQKPASATEMLDRESDLSIWSVYGQELENLFADDSWMVAPLALGGYLAEAHSPLLQVVYRRQLGRIQDALAKASSNYHFWQLWVRFKSAIPDKPLAGFLNEIKPLPRELGGGNDILDPRVVNLLIEDARKYGDWDFVRELLWSRFNIEFPPDIQQTHEGDKEKNERRDLVERADSNSIFQSFIEPLIETLVQSRQERLVLDVLYRFKTKRGTIPNMETRLKNLAKRLNRDDLSTSWINL